MPKTMHTPREELICGKLDSATIIAQAIGHVRLVHLLNDIRHDAERMEQALIRRKDEVSKLKMERLKKQELSNNTYMYGSISNGIKAWN